MQNMHQAGFLPWLDFELNFGTSEILIDKKRVREILRATATNVSQEDVANRLIVRPP